MTELENPQIEFFDIMFFLACVIFTVTLVYGAFNPKSSPTVHEGDTPIIFVDEGKDTPDINDIDIGDNVVKPRPHIEEDNFEYRLNALVDKLEENGYHCIYTN